MLLRTPIGAIYGEREDDIVEKTIEVRRLYKLKLPDAIIAATALIYEFALISWNTKDFKNIPELEVINPYEL
jgi:predicted nucleic acid-binding protein